MKVMQMVERDGVQVLEEGDKQRPVPGPGEILVRVHAAGVTTAELSWYPTTHSKDGGLRVAPVPSHEFSGTVERVAEAGASVAVGEAVYGMNDWFADGAAAEYCVTRPEFVAPMPRTLNYLQAAALPISALTAYQGLLVRGGLEAGERVLIHGGSGAVGLCAVQLARLHGARVFTTASGRHREALLDLGAEKVIDYRTERFESLLQEIDLVFDTIGGETLDCSWNVLSPRGRVVSVASDAEQSKDPRVQKAFFIVEPDREQLMEMSGLVEEGKLQPFVKAVVALKGAAAAYHGSVASESLGKIVLAVTTG